MKIYPIMLPFLIALIICPVVINSAQSSEWAHIIEIVQKFKKSERGPYKEIKWFCIDGAVVGPKEKCPEPGGFMRATYKDEVIKLGEREHIFLGQILTGTSFEKFLDEENQYSRMKQYQIEKYLRAIDNGWIIRLAQFYRGSLQAEDEENWGYNFFTKLLEDINITEEKFMFIRMSLKSIPHRGDDNLAQNVRAISKNLSDLFPSFMNIRVKIHGQPEEADIQLVQNFLDKNRNSFKPDQTSEFEALISEMKKAFPPVDLNMLKKYTNSLGKNSTIRVELEKLITNYSGKSSPEIIPQKLKQVSIMLSGIRQAIESEKATKRKLYLFEISLILENVLQREIDKWNTNDLKSVLEKNYCLAQAAAGAGYLENWEWNSIKYLIAPPATDSISILSLVQKIEMSKKAVEWGASLINAYYKKDVEVFTEFEPLTVTFLDDMIRSTILLPFGNLVGKLSDYAADYSGLRNNVLGIEDQNRIRGLNPGFAFGELVVVKGSPEKIIFSPKKIYVFERPPADLKPVAGILTISEGNLVSHIQLLARNLGIPNAILTSQNLNSLLKFAGQKVFLAVSQKGTVIMKLENEMNETEKSLFAQKSSPSEVINVPVDKLQLNVNRIVALKDLRAKDSGILCGPKAANLGELKNLFPDHVVNGFVIPFGIFYDHMNQILPGKQNSYWEFLLDSFSKIKKLEEKEEESEEMQSQIFAILKTLREEIKKINLKPEFVFDLRQNFTSNLSTELGKTAVFIRSDTNMEDLKDFTGAGLNLTLFNVVEEEKILAGIKEVWASPFTERSYKWRQKFLNNPENVFPSILVIPTVNVDKSGVLITTGVNSGNPEDMTIAFSRGAGGAVDGQAAESYTIKRDGQFSLLSPSRENSFNTLPKSGGTQKVITTFNQRLLTEKDISVLKKFGEEIKIILPGMPGIVSQGPFDVELGFLDGKIWLFQVRPFVESKSGLSSSYLNALNPIVPANRIISLSTSF
ncbi:MAG: PEP/pyruvate-binding domain-containing protein [Bacteroidota bacterium]